MSVCKQTPRKNVQLEKGFGENTTWNKQYKLITTVPDWKDMQWQVAKWSDKWRDFLYNPHLNFCKGMQFSKLLWE